MLRLSGPRAHGACAVIAALALSAGAPAQQAPPDDPAEMKRQLQELMKQNAEMQKKMAELQQRLERVEAKGATGASGPAAATGPTVAPPPPPAAPAHPQTPQDALDAAVSQGAPTTPKPAAPPKTGGSPADALNAAVGAAPSTAMPATGKTSDLFSFRSGSATVRLMDISMVIDTAAGWSSQKDNSLQTLQGGDHDPKKRGFTLQAAELGVSGAVDPYFTAQANINYNIDAASGESNVELEEAFATSTSLPGGFQVKAGQYFTEFGIMNQTHPHTWDWMDQPVVLSRFMSGDGMRAPGARVAWLAPLPWYSQFIVGAQDANGGPMVSFVANADTFADRGIGGRPFADPTVRNLGDIVYSGRWENFFDLNSQTTLKVGASVATGPNRSGDSEQTTIYGADFKLKWRPASTERGWPFVIWQTEVMARDYGAAAATSDGVTYPKETLHDWGYYTQVLYGFTPDWAAGLRFEQAGGSGQSVGGTRNDPFRDERDRLSPLLVWQLSEFSRLRVQYNHDWAQHIESGQADSLYLGLEVLFGAHPAHTY